MQLLGKGKLLALLVIVLGLFAAPRDAHAYAWMLKHGYAKCGSCHVDPSGGELLSGMGRVQSDLLLSAGAPEDGYPRERAKFLFGVGEPNAVRLGGSLRFMGILKDGDLRAFPMQADVYAGAQFGRLVLGGSLGYAQLPAGSPHGQAAMITSNIEDKAPNLLSRSHYVGVELADGYLLRAGRLNLPYGLRISEHVMWVREATRTDRESDQQHGVALAVNRGSWHSEMMLIAGNYQLSPDDYRERGYSLYIEHLLSRDMAIGFNSLWTKARKDRLTLGDRGYARTAQGLTGRFGLSPKFALLAEADILKNSGSGMGYTGMLQGDFEFSRGLHAMGTVELLDQGKPNAGEAIPGAGEMKYGLWLSAAYYFLSHFDARLDVLVRKEDPLTIQAQGHFYF